MDKTKIKKILLVSLSNLGDAVLSTPVLFILKKEFPEAMIDLVCGSAAASAFQGDQDIHSMHVYDKKAGFIEKIRWVKNLRKKHYDLVVDLKNSSIGLLIKPRYRTSILRGKTQGMHMQNVHLRKLQELGLDTSYAKRRIYVSEKSVEEARGLMGPIDVSKRTIVINPSAKSHLKEWPLQYYVQLAALIKKNYPVNIISVGSIKEQAPLDKLSIEQNVTINNLCGKTTLQELAAILSMSDVLITNDTATMHIAGAYNQLKVIALFGPTDPVKYGPLGAHDSVVRLKLKCSPCEKARCAIKTHECMQALSVDKVYEKFKTVV